jgi:plasmid stability protein
VKNITVSVEEELYHSARVQAAKRRKSLSALVREFLAGLVEGEDNETAGASKAELAKLFAMSDRKHRKKRGSVGPLNREELYERGISRH